ncbi:helix-turn-helix domain-containing protein [Nonomuraea sp. NPDC005650]|uniref:helix-turn-helix domain-containing protein n=1 Tax=Nonomuraea sp. NPDC005650 TaxID=3157045 RepID=UPI0033B677BE
MTAEDRRRIADGLTAGLTYADIARRLGRSRSTVTREIARNGGPHGYRAVRAQHATSWRARRRRRTPHNDVPRTTDSRDARTAREFERVAVVPPDARAPLQRCACSRTSVDALPLAPQPRLGPVGPVSVIVTVSLTERPSERRLRRA